MTDIKLSAAIIYRGDEYEVEWQVECGDHTGWGSSFNDAVASLEERMEDKADEMNRPKRVRR